MKRFYLFVTLLIASIVTTFAQESKYLNYALKDIQEYNYERAQKNYNIYRDLSGKRDYSVEAKLIWRFTKKPNGQYSYNDNIVLSFKRNSSTKFESPLEDAVLKELVEMLPQLISTESIENINLKLFVNGSSVDHGLADQRADFIKKKIPVSSTDLKKTSNWNELDKAEIIIENSNLVWETPKKPKPLPEQYVAPDGYVDLGLSVFWATCNLGASRPQDYGDYFSWGDLEPKFSYTKENTPSYNKKMKNIDGHPDFDAVTHRNSIEYKMPSKRDIEELQDNTTAEWTTMEGIKGLLLTSKINGKSIFLPACGYRNGRQRRPGGTEGGYWSGTPSDEDMYSFSMLVLEDGIGTNNYERHAGFCIRPVCLKIPKHYPAAR